MTHHSHQQAVDEDENEFNKRSFAGKPSINLVKTVSKMLFKLYDSSGKELKVRIFRDIRVNVPIRYTYQPRLAPVTSDNIYFFL